MAYFKRYFLGKRRGGAGRVGVGVKEGKKGGGGGVIIKRAGDE